MCSKKLDLEIVCNLQWKNGKPSNGGERSNIVGVYDVPNTTLNWKIFKSYLLKNSGTPGDDVKVSYLATNDREFPIQTQLDFQIALYAFRKKARNGEIIILKLERITEKDKTVEKSATSNDVQTQFDTDGEGACSNYAVDSSKTAPQWFTNYMTEFKKDILGEVSTTVSSYLSTIKPHGVQSYHSRKSKPESSKRLRKQPLSFCDVGNEKEFLKTLKVEKKVESKLEKLENKTKKLKEKKMSLLTKSSDSDAGHSSSKSNSEALTNVEWLQMNAAPVRYQQSVVPHMVGGEVYLHTWEVINNGTLSWTSDTELHFTWGSACLEPVDRVVPCPPLKPGETGSINVLLNVPETCGQYESYWYFHHKGRKFGHWLGCQIIVDKVNSPEPLSKPFFRNYEKLKEAVLRPKYKAEPLAYPFFERNQPVIRNYMDLEEFDTAIVDPLKNFRQQLEKEPEQMPIIEEKMKDLQIAEEASCSKTNPQIARENANEEYIFVTRAPCSSSNEMTSEEKTPTPQTEIEQVVLNASPSKIQIVEKFLNELDTGDKCNLLQETASDFKEANQNKQIDAALESDDNNNNTEGVQDSSSESISKIDEDTTSNSTLNDMVMINFADEMDDNISGYAYVVVDGIKIPIPKKYLRSDFLETAEDAPDPSNSVNEMTEEKETVSPLACIVKSEMNQALDQNKSIIFEHICDENPIQETLPKIEPPTSNLPQKSTPIQVNEVTYNFSSEERKKSNESVSSNQPIPILHNPTMSPIDMSMSEKPESSRVFVFPLNSPGYEFMHIHRDLPRETNTQYGPVNDSPINNKFMKRNIYKQDATETNIIQEYNNYDPLLRCINPPVLMPATYIPIKNRQPRPNPPMMHVPNYQQTPPDQRWRKLRKELPPRTPEPPTSTTTNPSSTYSFTCSSGNTYSTDPNTTNAHVSSAPSAPLPRTSVVSGAMTMASSALNTAKNVVNMIIPARPENGMWMNGHWVVTNPECPREANLQALAEMGFWDRDLNATLLARYNDDIAQVVADLIQ